MSDCELTQALAKCHGTLARALNELWELGWPERDEDLLWEVRQTLALVNKALSGPELSEEEAEQVRTAVADALCSASAMSAVVEGNALLSRLSKPR